MYSLMSLWAFFDPTQASFPLPPSPLPPRAPAHSSWRLSEAQHPGGATRAHYVAGPAALGGLITGPMACESEPGCHSRTNGVGAGALGVRVENDKLYQIRSGSLPISRRTLQRQPCKQQAWCRASSAGSGARILSLLAHDVARGGGRATLSANAADAATRRTPHFPKTCQWNFLHAVSLVGLLHVAH